MVVRRVGLCQVFGVVQLMVLSLPAMQREKEEVGGVGTAEMCKNWVLPLCLKTGLFLHLCYKSQAKTETGNSEMTTVITN